MLRNSIKHSLSKSLLAGSAAFLLFWSSSCGGGGGDPTKPSDENFKRLIDEYLATHKEGKDCFDMNGVLPYNLPKGQDDHLERALEGAGLLQSAQVKATTSHILGYNPGAQTVTQFSATEAGKKYLSTYEPPGSQEIEHVCWANIRVDKIVKWINHPADNSAAVNWTYQLTDVPDWAKSPAVQAGENTIKFRFDNEKKLIRGAALALSNKGWEVNQVYWDANQ